MSLNRQIQVSVTFTCIRHPDGSFGGTAAYAQTATLPETALTLVEPTGAIRVDQWTDFDKAVYSENVDIYFRLVTPCNVTPDGTTARVAWATLYGAGMTVQAPEGGSAGEFRVATFVDDPNLILVEDNDDDTNTYQYKPAVELIDNGHYFISLDPPIVNKPPQ